MIILLILESTFHSDITLCKTCSSDKSSNPRYDIHILKQSEVYFLVGYAILIDFGRPNNIKFEKNCFIVVINQDPRSGSLTINDYNIQGITTKSVYIYICYTLYYNIFFKFYVMGPTEINLYNAT